MHEAVALQILVLLLERPTDDSIEIAREVGAFLSENSPKANATVFERFRAVLNEGKISQRVQYMIEVLMQVRKDKPIIYETSPDFLDTFLPPTAGHGRDRDDKYYHRRHDRRERMLFLFHIHFSCYIFLFFFSSYGKVH